MERDYVIIHYVAALLPKEFIMAEWPANAETDWNTKMLAYLAVEHNTDGTHDFGSLSGTSDSIGEFSVGALQIKWGFKSGLAANTTVALDFTDEGLSDFSNACLQVLTGIRGASATDTFIIKTSSYGTDGFSVTNTNTGTVTYNWFAIGR